MKQFIHKPQHLKTHRILPGHGHGSRFTSDAALPGVDRDEGKARRSTWTDRQAERRFQYGRGSSIGLAGAVLALALTLAAALGPRANVLDVPDVPAETPVHLVAAPTTAASTAAPKS